MSRPKIYYAHALSHFGIPQETWVMDALAMAWDVENPNQPHHQEGYDRRGMEHFLDIIDEECDACAFSAYSDGHVGAGVAMEVARFFEQGKPVFEAVVLPSRAPGSHVVALIPMSWLDPVRVLTREMTRARTQKGEC